MKRKVVKVYESDWNFVENEFEGNTKADKFNAMLNEYMKLQKMCRIYDEMVKIYKKNEDKMHRTIVEQNNEIARLYELIQKQEEEIQMLKEKINKRGILKKIFG